MIIQTQTVYTDPQNAPQGYLAYPDDGLQHPGIVLIQEWWGVEPFVITVAQRLAREGFVVLVPDLYHGRVAGEPDDAKKLVMMAMQNVEGALHEIELALKFLKNDARVQPKRLGITGHCLGGTLAFKAACRFPEIAAVSPWYGGGIDPAAEDLSKLTAPIMAFFGALDQGIPVEKVRAIEQRSRPPAKPSP